MAGTRRGHRLVVATASGLAALLGLVGVSACRSLPKDAVETGLLALPKNTPVREIGLERHTLDIEIDGQAMSVETTYLHVPASQPADPPLPPVVLVHGTPSSLVTWTWLIFGRDGGQGLVATLPDRDVYAIDVIGHGTTRSDVSPITFQRCADHVAGTIRALGLRDVCLVGNSYGGEFCWRAALDHPDAIGRLVLLDTSGSKRRDDEWLPEEIAMRENPLAKIGYVVNSRENIRHALVPHFPDGVSDDQVEEVFLVCENSANWKGMVDLAIDEEAHRESELGSISQPTLLVWGADDVAYGVERFARIFEREIPTSRLVLVEGSGHYPQESQPAEVARLLAEFLAE